ncbi:MAG: hypothetical protein M1536_01990 [Firmicutes bacterium]|nr:hypothetical protein [Bacillota bacterium]
MSMKKILVISLVSLFIFAFSIAAVSADTKTVALNISPGQWVAEQHIGILTVPQGNSASNFTANISIYNEWGKLMKYPTFTIQKRNDDGNYITVYEQSWMKYEWDRMYNRYARNWDKYMHEKRLVETPVPLSQLTLGPGHYVVNMDGYGGSSLTLTCTIQP